MLHLTKSDWIPVTTVILHVSDPCWAGLKIGFSGEIAQV